MRDRLYRRFVEEKHIIKRLRRKINWYGKWYRDANNLPVNKILISSFLNKKEYFDSKNISTNKSETKLKIKYSNSYYPHKGIKTRKFDKIQFLKILKEYGIK